MARRGAGVDGGTLCYAGELA
eukprot:COSAG01_NODE_33608_length_561_cov_1.556277_2_plen_20_part_01